MVGQNAAPFSGLVDSFFVAFEKFFALFRVPYLENIQDKGFGSSRLFACKWRHRGAAWRRVRLVANARAGFPPSAADVRRAGAG